MAPKVEYADNLGPSRQEDGTIEGTSEEIIDNPDKATAFAISGIDEHYDIDSDNSPQPEVRANVPNVDDPSMPVNTLRAWTLGLLFTILGTGINQFFSMRYPSITISSLVAQLVAYPAGRALAHTLPIMKITLLGKEIALNPDHHFNIKEHALITIMSNLSFGPSWATDIIQAQVAPAFLGLKTPVGYQFLLALTMQLFGLGMAGMAYRFIVEPPHMVWPSTLANAALFQTLHGRANPKADGWSISRYRFFVYVFAGGWLWYWLPGFLFTGLSTFAFICWAAPNNIIVNNLFGMSTGLAYLPTTFDWSQIAYNGSPLVVPFWAQANVFAGWVILFALVTPILYYTNTWYTAHLPFSGGDIYDNTGNVFNASRVVDRHGNFSPEAYRDYSPIFMPVTFALGYGISFATMTCVPTYIFLNYWKQIVGAFNPQRKKDIHARLIERYPDAPWWWYAALTAIVLGLTIMVQEVYDTQMPVWGVFLAFGLAAFYLIPTGSVYAVANLNSNVLTVLGEIISGYAIPGKPVVMLIFKFYAYTGLSQAMIFASDMKLGLYMKIPRRTLFVAQLTACIVGSLTQNAVVLWMLHHVKEICESDQPNKYTCPQGRVNFSSSIVWGAVGPARLYSVGKIYSGLLHLFWLGALLPVVTFLLKKKYPNSKLLRTLHWPLFFAGTGNVPPATGINYSSAFAVSFIFNKWIRGKYPHWWAKYNYVLSAALDSGLAISAIVIFFALVFPGIAKGLLFVLLMKVARDHYKPKNNKIHVYISGGSGGSLITFLGLAAALVTTMGAFESATALSLMLRNTTTDKSLLPTTKQLRDLLSVLDARLARSRFTDSVLGWHKYLYKHPDIDDASRNVLRRDSSYPSVEATEKLVSAFRQLHRIGDSSVSKIAVHLTSSSPWVIAFTRWCLGAPPSVYLQDGTPIIEQPDLSVDIIINTGHTEDDQNFVVTIYHDIGDPENLIATNSGKPWAGMTTIENYGQWMLKEYNLDQVQAFRALQQCLPYAAKEYLNQCRFTASKAHQAPITRNSRQRDEKVVEEYRTVPFGSDSSVAEMICRMLNVEKEGTSFELEKLEAGVRITDLPLVKLHLKSLRNDCLCQACADRSSERHDISAWRGGCLKDQFLYDAALFLSDALALSLFHLSDNLLVRIENGRDRRRDDYHTTVFSIFTHQSVGYSISSDIKEPCKIEALLDWALMLIGHDVGTEVSTSRWAMSCFKGQAAYPTIFDTRRMKKRGYLRLSWLPGILQFQSEKYEVVKSEKERQNPPPPSSKVLSSREVIRPLNLFPNYRLKWRVEAKDGFLNLGVYLEGPSVDIIRNPTEAISALACSLVFERCKHANRDAELESPDQFCGYTSPLMPNEYLRNKTRIVAVDGADDLRFYALTEIALSMSVEV
ncbi:hypothetical protein FVER53590_08400 [Fusarium verticillioides]|nr:hypothetical protein FVER53590_08400 [Fusarium verticillioides]